MSCGHAAHVDSVDSLWLPTLSTIAWTTLRVAHMSTGPKAAGSLRQKNRVKNNRKFDGWSGDVLN